MTQQEIDLQKIQLIESSYQTWFNFRASILITGVISIFILDLTLFAEELVFLSTYVFIYVVAVILLVVCLNFLRTQHQKHVEFIDEAVLRIETGKKLESIKELRAIHANWKTQKNQTMQKVIPVISEE